MVGGGGGVMVDGVVGGWKAWGVGIWWKVWTEGKVGVPKCWGSWYGGEGSCGCIVQGETVRKRRERR